MTDGLTFNGTVFHVTSGVAISLVTGILCLAAWWRSGFAAKTGCLEALRLVIVMLVALMLNQPEWVVWHEPDERPTLVVLRDVSGSMQTRDIVASGDDVSIPRTRHEVAGELTRDDRWEPLRDKLAVVVEPFSSRLSPPVAGTDLNDALTSCLERHENLRGIVLLSDGDWNTGDPPLRAASRLRMQKMPVFAISVGSDSRLPDIELLRVDAPTFGVVGKPIRIPFSITSALPRDLQTTVTLTSSSGSEVTRRVTVPAMSRLDETMLWKPVQIGEDTVTISVPVADDELNRENNRRSAPVSIREEALKVLLVESVPRWEYRFLRNALERDPGVDVSCLLFHPGLSKFGGGRGYLKAFPATMEELSQFDVVFLGDVGLGNGQLTLEQCRLIKGLVEGQASGLILMPGLRGAHLSLVETELDSLYPVVLDRAQPTGWGSQLPAQFELTDLGQRSLLTRLEDQEDENSATWEALPGFQWYAPVLRAKAGSAVLAKHKTESNQHGRIPLLVTKTYGTGKILFMGTDGAWRWRKGVEDKYHYRFWGQVARWMAYQRRMAEGKLMRLFFSPDRPETGDVVTLHANVAGKNGEPLQNGLVVVQVIAPSGKAETIRLAPHGDEWGLFSHSFTPHERGSYKLTLSCRDNDSSLVTTLNVQGIDREKLGQPVRTDVLNEIVEMTGGSMVPVGEAKNLLQKIADLPPRDPTFRRIRLWCHPLWAGSLLFLLAIFWIGRKMTGNV